MRSPAHHELEVWCPESSDCVQEDLGVQLVRRKNIRGIQRIAYPFFCVVWSVRTRSGDSVNPICVFWGGGSLPLSGYFAFGLNTPLPPPFMIKPRICLDFSRVAGGTTPPSKKIKKRI